jgi:hypothetical protein
MMVKKDLLLRIKSGPSGQKDPLLLIKSGQSGQKNLK